MTINIAKMRAEIETHIAADAVRGGPYWDEGTRTGCFIGCLAHSNSASLLGDLYGLPLPLVRLCEQVFEALPQADRPVFFREVGEAVRRDGKNLTRVHWRLLGSALRRQPSDRRTDAVISGMDLLARGEEWPEAAVAEAAWAAPRAARAAARAARAAARAARAAADAAAAEEAAEEAAAEAAAVALAASVAADEAAMAVMTAAEEARAAVEEARAAEIQLQRADLLRLISEAPVGEARA